MSNRAFLYILLFPGMGSFKIGISYDVPNRIQNLRKHWGEPDYPNSYVLEADRRTVAGLERALKFLLVEMGASLKKRGDGHTEFFNVEALDVALKHIELYTTTRENRPAIRQGIERPTPPPPKPASICNVGKRRLGRRAKIRNGSRQMVSSVVRAAEKFDRINRYLLILQAKQSKIQFEYDIKDDHVLFRVRSDHPGWRSPKLMALFSFDFQDVRGFGGFNLLDYQRQGDVVQYRVDLPHARSLLSSDVGHHAALLSYMSRQSEAILRTLPRRSAAALVAIPEIPFRSIGDLLEEAWSR